ncbi:MAG: Lsm family RNA-binding protein [Nitrososphaerales archaeon]
MTARRFGKEILAFVGKRVYVEISEAKVYKATLAGVDEKSGIVLEDIEGSDEVSRLIVKRNFVKEIKLIEKPFDILALADRLNKIFPGLVKIMDDISAIVVMDKIKVTQRGVAEGDGLAAEKVKAIYEEFVRENK